MRREKEHLKSTCLVGLQISVFTCPHLEESQMQSKYAWILNQSMLSTHAFNSPFQLMLLLILQDFLSFENGFWLEITIYQAYNFTQTH